MKKIIRGDSLSPKFNDGDEIELTDLKNSILNRNDVVVFKHAGVKELIKYCVGLPGDSISLDKDIIKINDKSLPLTLESTASEYCWKDWIKFNNGKIPNQHIFVLGSTQNSLDSRKFGYVNLSEVIGKI